MQTTSVSPASATTDPPPAEKPIQGTYTSPCPPVPKVPSVIAHRFPTTRRLPHGTVVFRCHACGIRLTD